MSMAALLLGVALVAPSASHNDNVEWDGVTHVAWLDRAPLCPIDGESFTVSFQTYHFDITAARVRVDDGSVTWVDAHFSYNRGPYDVWTAAIPASDPTGTLAYYIELTDGADTDYLGPDGMSSDPPANGWVLDFVTLDHAPVGATLTTDGSAVFKVWAAGAARANVAGDFNGWSATSRPMDQRGDYFVRRVPDTVRDGQEYKYIFGGSTWKPDARGRAQNPDNNDNSIIIDPDGHAWNDHGFEIPPFEETVIYELHIGTFSGRGDGLGRMGRFRDVVDTHLDDLLELGVNAVELMPIAEFDYYQSWGYNPVNQWAPENAYGDPEDLKYMIDGLHRHGIAVLLDVVYNHFSHSGNFLWYYDGTQIYFDDPACDTPWGSQAAFWKQEVREYFIDNIMHWLDEYHVDGYRMDATSYMRDPLGCYPQGWTLMQAINDVIDARRGDAISIAEELPDNGWVTKVTAEDGAGFDSQWHDRFVDDVRQEIFDAALGDPEIWKVRDAVLGRLNDDGGSFITDWGQSTTQLVNYVESHDEADDARLAVAIDGGDPYGVWAKGRSKLAQGLTILSPGIPMFLQGGEWMEDIPFGSEYGNRIDWAKAAARGPIRLFFHDVIAVRKSNCGLRSNAGVEVIHENDSTNVLALHRWDLSGNDLVVVVNFSNNNYTDYNMSFPQGGTWFEILNSQAAEYDGNGWGNGGSVFADESAPHGVSMTVPQMGLLVFRYEDPAGRSADLNGDGFVDLRDHALLQQRIGEQGCGLGADLNEDGRVDVNDFPPMAASFTGPGA